MFEKLFAADDMSAYIGHVPEIALPNLLCDRGSAVAQNRNFIIQGYCIITGCADAVWSGSSCQNDMTYTFTAQNQVEPGAEKGGLAGFDKLVIPAAGDEYLRHGGRNRFFTTGREGLPAFQPYVITGMFHIASVCCVFPSYEKNRNTLVPAEGDYICT